MATIHFTPVRPGVGAIQSDSQSSYIQPMYSQEKKNLVTKISRLSKEAHLEIYFLLKKYVSSSQYTLSRNGAFFNLNTLSHRVLRELSELVDFCCENEERLKLSHRDKKDILLHSSEKEKVKEEEEEEDSSSNSESSSSDEESDDSSDEDEKIIPAKKSLPVKKVLPKKKVQSKKRKMV